MACNEADELTALYLAAVANITEAGKAIPNPKTDEWRAATQESRRDAQEALDGLNKHKREHGCGS